jgi:sugar lactone lactonase YvrE
MIEVLCHPHDQVGESPVWSVAEQALYWVDIEGRAVRRFDWASRTLRSWAVSERIGSIALHAAGGLLAAMETGLFHLQLPDADRAEASLLHPVRFARPDMRFNDGRCDPEGRFWVSSMVRDTSLGVPAGSLYCFDGQTLTAPIPTGLITGNGLAVSPAGNWLYLSDSHASVRQLWRAPLARDGTLGPRQPFGDWQTLPGRPDGAAVDDAGGYWSCANDAGRLHRFHPDGRWDRSLELPISKPAMCAFGGPELEHLFITSITPAAPVPGFDPGLDGAVFVCRPGARGLPEPLFQPRP